MSHKPSYLGLLNAIAVGEQQTCDLLRCWSKVTGNSDLASVLEFVAIREAEHAAAFTKRVCELGFTLRRSNAEKFERRLKLASSDASDRKKFRKLLGITDSSDSKDPFDSLFNDTTIDPHTGALLGRYIAEERDSGRCLRQAFSELPATPAQSAKSALITEDDPVLKDIAQRLDRLSNTLQELKAIRR